MSAAAATREQRQFGRRESRIRGRAVFAGQIPQPLTIRNISDGGALLFFDQPCIPPKSFRIEIDDTSFAVLCEVRHQGGYGVGVRFVRPAEGVALNRHFQLRPVAGVGDTLPTVAPLAAAPLEPTRSRDLRRLLQSARTPVVVPVTSLLSRANSLVCLAAAAMLRTSEPGEPSRHKGLSEMRSGVVAEPR